MWFDYEGDTVLLNRDPPQGSWSGSGPTRGSLSLLVNPDNAYCWVSIKCTIRREILEDDPEGGAQVGATRPHLDEVHRAGPALRAALIQPSTSAECCSSARWTGWPRSASRDHAGRW